MFFGQSSRDRLDVKSAMETWMVEKAYPVVTVNRRGSEISITQDPFIFANTPASKSSTATFLHNEMIFKYLWHFVVLLQTNDFIQMDDSFLVWHFR